MRSAIAILCTAALVAAGCGDDDDEDTTALETTTATQPETVTAPAPDEGEPDAPDEPDSPDADGEPEAEPPAPEDTNNDGAIGAPGRCGRVAFTPNTDHGAFGIESVGVSCDTARAVARGARGRTDELAYEARGFSCSGARRENQPLPTVEWVCLRGDDNLIRFSTG